MLVKTLLIVAVLFVAILSSGAASSVNAVAVTFNNGSSLTLDNSFFDNSFPQIQQKGLSPNPYDWELSLVTPDTFNHLCSTPVYLGQGSKCDQMQFKNAPSATPNNDGSGVQLIYLDTDSLNRKWQATVNIICDPSRDKLYSPSNSYDAAQPADTIVVSFVMTSRGACLNAGPAPGPGNNGGDDDKKSGGLTWGGVFLIIFFVPLGLYVIGFVAWNYKQGMTGKDLAPHPEFWGSLPGLCKDGVTFLWSKIRGTEWTPSEAGSSGGGGASESAAGAGASGGYAAV